jgi:hypothetical protein
MVDAQTFSADGGALQSAPMDPTAPLMDAPPMMAMPAPLAERLPAETLHKMYLAWEQAKVGENNEMYQASRYYHGKQWTDSELKVLARRKQQPIVKNIIKRKVDFLVGLEQRLRRDPKGYGREPSDEKAATVATAVLRSVEDAAKWQAIASECARDALIRGIGAQWAGVAKNRKSKFDIKKFHVPGDRFFYDPKSERWDFSDAGFLGEHQWIGNDQAKEMLPWAVDMIDQLGDISAGGDSMLPWLFEKEKNWQPYVNGKERRIRLISISYRHKGEWLFDYLVGPISLCPSEPITSTDPQTGQERTIPPMDCRSPYVDENDQTIHPYEAWSPYVDEAGDRYSMIRDMIPLQDEVNKRRSKSLHLLTVRQTQSEKGAVADLDKMKVELAKPDGHVETNPGKEIKVIDQTAQIQGNLELMQDAENSLANLGPNPALQGKGVENQSGRAILAQQNSGMAELSPVYERMREWKLRCYRRDWNLVRQFYTDERIIRVTGDPNAVQYLKINAPIVDPMTGQVTGVENQVAEIDVDIILDEGPDTVTMREELMQQLSQLGPGVIPPELLIEMSNITEKDALLKKLAEFKAPPPELQDLQKRMAQLEELTAAADLDKKRADTEKTRADTIGALVGAGVLPQAMEAFPFYYREPTFLDQAQGMSSTPPMPQNALGGPPAGGAGPDGGMPPPNALAGPGQPPGAEEPTDFLAMSSTPWLPGDEPHLNQEGGLPMPNG